jgi:SAM-dependent methyltransferase
MDEQAIREFWQEHACGDAQIGGLREHFGGDYDKFFAAYDQFRYRTERHLPACLDALPVTDADVLEIGLGEGSDSERIIRRGARWSGVDITAESVARVRTRLRQRGLPFAALHQASVVDLPFADNSFDLVFSHGVLHHVPDIDVAQKEIHRVLRPEGELVVMVYARRSLNYMVSIGLIRRAILLAAYPLGRSGLLKQGTTPALLTGHLANAQATGLRRYLRLEEFINHNTAGPQNPYSKVYAARRIAQDFASFRITRTYKRFMHAPPLPVHRLPGESVLGWHLWVHLRPS